MKKKNLKEEDQKKKNNDIEINSTDVDEEIIINESLPGELLNTKHIILE
jgi:hypothetical protein